VRPRGPGGGERTVMVSQPAFAPSGKAWRPFTFKNLERVTQAQTILTEKLEWLLPSASSSGRVSLAVLARLKELFEVDADLVVDSVHTIRPQDFRRHVSDPTFFATLAPLPHKTRGFMEIELGLAHAAIDTLLGGAGEAVALRPLTDIEEGVMGFVVLEALRALSPSVDPGLPRLRMEGMVRGVDEAVALLGDEQNVVVVQFKCVLGPHSGFIRLFIPATVLTLASPPDQAPESRARRRARIERYVGRLSGVKTWLRAEIGHAEVGAQDLASLRHGDVVLCDELTVRTDRGEAGAAQLRVGMGLGGRVDAEVFLDDGHYKARLSAFVYGEPSRYGGEGEDEVDDEDHTNPSGARAPGERTPLEETTLKEGGELLNDIPLQIAVELARVPVTAEQVVSLRVGQVVDLNRVPGEPVELSVNGRIVARGELVEVEGHLGVRILSMAG
jgi:type III secretion system YscQ/HrcQ family protein